MSEWRQHQRYLQLLEPLGVYPLKVSGGVASGYTESYLKPSPSTEATK